MPSVLLDGVWQWGSRTLALPAPRPICQWAALHPDHTEILRLGEQASLSNPGDDETRRCARVDCGERLRLVFEATQDGVWDWDVGSGNVTVNARVLELLGAPAHRSRWPLRRLLGFIQRQDRRRILDTLLRSSGSKGPCSLAFRIGPQVSQRRWIQGRGQVIARHSDSTPARVLGTLTDVTHQHLQEEQLRQAAKVFEATTDGVIVTDARRRILRVNPAFSEITGYSAEETQGTCLGDPRSSGIDRALLRAIRTEVGRTGRWHGEAWLQRRNGEAYLARLSVTTIHAADGVLNNYVLVFGDITDEQQSQAHIDFLTHHDALTGLANRELFRLRLRHSLQRAEHQGQIVAVILLDLARFRLVNEALGPASGDQLLRLVAQQLTDAVETGDTLARVGGDEFGLIAEHCESLQAVTLRAEALLNACAKPQTIGGTTWTIEACVGIAVYPLDGDLWQTLIRHATVALKRAKARGPRTLQYFAPGMAQDVQKRLQLEAGLRRARVDGELWLAFQPQVRLSDGQIAGAEALLRWQSRRLGAISPTQFISLAEEIGLIGELGLWVIEKGCEQLARWEHLGFYVPRLAVNVSILQIEGDGLLDAVIAILTRTGIKPCRLELEITESMIMRRAEQTINQLRALRDLGLTIAIDDFGTGYSSLAYLRRLPLHQLKIDKSFIDDLPADTNSQAVARAVIGLGQSLGLETLAEGVENAAQAAWLKQAGCDLVQGYLYDRPRPAAEFAAGCRMASGPGIALRGDG